MSRTRQNPSGRIIDVLAIAIVLGLLGMAIWWIIKTTGQASQQGAKAIVNTHHKAMNLTCQMNMDAIFKNLNIYAISNERFPESQSGLMEFSGTTKGFHCPDPNGSPYVYVPGQSGDMSPSNVLLYESKPVHDGKCNVLFLGGQIEMLTPEELKQAVEATIAHLRRE